MSKGGAPRGNQMDVEKNLSSKDPFLPREAEEELGDFVARPVTAYEDCPERE